MDFFRKAKDTMSGGGRLEVSKIKSLLVQKLVQRETDTVERKVKGKYLPLSVWEKQGFDVVAIENGAEKQKSDLLLASVGFCIKVCGSRSILIGSLFFKLDLVRW